MRIYCFSLFYDSAIATKGNTVGKSPAPSRKILKFSKILKLAVLKLRICFEEVSGEGAAGGRISGGFIRGVNPTINPALTSSNAHKSYHFLFAVISIITRQTGS